ncbi:uncharacterized protein LOC126694203 [Quercus robur]|uniref:uncharacterized protein LOC126694203 n=1 Tax=Quercus robur TaxID=38942 RepID=UPI002162030B|nr:uncharacterized protein LOC126694203 [Quercus robur]
MAIDKLSNDPNPNQNPKPKQKKFQWCELVDEDDGKDLDFLLPPRQVIGPDERGVKKVVEYKFDDEGNEVKKTTTTLVQKLAKTQLSKRAMERRAWPKFGDAVHDDVGARLTMVSTEDIFLERPRPHGSKPEETEVAGNLGNAGAVLMVCRICNTKGVHWTAKCPDRYLAHHTDDPRANEGAYVPPSLRRGAERPGGSDVRRQSDENSVRVTNLSEDTREPDLLELFQTFGHVTRAYVAIDQKTGMSRGFGFVNFVNREDAERAINKLNGYGYDNLILRVEWATPRSN